MICRTSWQWPSVDICTQQMQRDLVERFYYAIAMCGDLCKRLYYSSTRSREGREMQPVQQFETSCLDCSTGAGRWHGCDLATSVATPYLLCATYTKKYTYILLALCKYGTSSKKIPFQNLTVSWIQTQRRNSYYIRADLNRCFVPIFVWESACCMWDDRSPARIKANYRTDHRLPFQL